jgi:hypothetical protein
MKTYRGVDVYFHAFLNSALNGVEWYSFTSRRFTTDNRWIRGRVGPQSLCGGGSEDKNHLFFPAGKRT